jgi:hypothetical protein
MLLREKDNILDCKRCREILSLVRLVTLALAQQSWDRTM